MQQLCFEVSSSKLKYTIFDSDSKTPLKSNECLLHGRVAELKKEDCSNFLRNENLLDFSGEVSLAYLGKHVTLVPQVIFGESNAKSIFELCYGPSEELIEHNRFYEQSLVVIYEIDDWIKRFFVVRFPRITIQHVATHVLRGIFGNDTFTPKMHLYEENNFVTLILISKNNILGFNTFDFTNEDDLFYYISHVWNTSHLTDQKRTIVYHSDNEKNELFESLAKSLRRQYTNQEYAITQISRIKHQLLCV